MDIPIVIPAFGGLSPIHTVCAPSAAGLRTRVLALFAAIVANADYANAVICGFRVAGAGEGMWQCTFTLLADQSPDTGEIPIEIANVWFVEGTGQGDEAIDATPDVSHMGALLAAAVTADLGEGDVASLDFVDDGGFMGRRFCLGAVGTIVSG